MLVRSWDDPRYPGGYFGTLYFANPDYKMLYPAFLRDPAVMKDDSEDPAGHLPFNYYFPHADLD
jgi:hypothetical protein